MSIHKYNHFQTKNQLVTIQIHLDYQGNLNYSEKNQYALTKQVIKILGTSLKILTE